jgi:hypothetical protein
MEGEAAVVGSWKRCFKKNASKAIIGSQGVRSLVLLDLRGVELLSAGVGRKQPVLHRNSQVKDPWRTESVEAELCRPVVRSSAQSDTYPSRMRN